MGQRDWAKSVGRQLSERCKHTKTLSTMTAGIERIVCEACAHVSLRYREPGAFWPDTQIEPTPPRKTDVTEAVVDLTAEPEPEAKQLRCSACGETAIFLTPAGIACAEHAWAAANTQLSIETEIWIPILIDRSAVQTRDQ